MRLIYLANLRLPTEKAYGIQIAKMCEAFAALKFKVESEKLKGLTVELVAPHRKNKIKDDFFDYYGIKRNFKFKKIWAPDFYLPGTLNQIAFALKSFISALILSFYTLMHKADIIYTRDEWSAYVLSFFKKNVVFEVHKFSRARNPFYKRFIKVGIKAVVISNGLKSDFVSFGFSGDKILVAPDGVDLRKFDISISKEEAREKTNLPLDKKIVMYTGHLFEWKGADVLLEAARNIEISKYRNGEFLFVFIGGTEHDVKEFRKKAEGLNNVLILGHKPHRDIPAYLKAADILVLPNSAKEEISSKHTSPLKLFEYMASNRPIVASNLLSIKEILNDENSVLVKPNDPAALAEGIKTVLGDDSLAEDLAKKAFEGIQDYTWQKRAEKIIDFIK